MPSTTLSDLQKEWFAEDTGQPVEPDSSFDWLKAGSNALGSAIGGTASGSSGPSSADALFGTNLQFDNSGWNVAFGQSTINSSSDKTTSQRSSGNLPGNLSTYIPWALALFVVIIILKKHKK